MTKTTSEAELGAEDSKDCTVDSMDNCRLRARSIGRTDRELGFLDNISDDILDSTDPTVDPADCTKFTDNSTGFTDPTMESTGCTNCAKLTGVQKRYVSDSKDQRLYANPLVEALRMQEHGLGPPNASWQGQ